MTDTEQEEEPVSQPEQEPAAAEEEQDKIKPVIYIGLVLLALFSLGEFEMVCVHNLTDNLYRYGLIWSLYDFLIISLYY